MSYRYIGVAFIGEIGLGGELRGGRSLDLRISEAQKMGFHTIIVPQRSGFGSRTSTGSSKSSTSSYKATKGVLTCSSLKEALALAFQVDDVESRIRGLTSRRKNKSNEDKEAAAGERGSSSRGQFSQSPSSWPSPHSSPAWSQGLYKSSADVEEGADDFDLDSDDDSSDGALQ